jgi:hypothetical protein
MMKAPHALLGIGSLATVTLLAFSGCNAQQLRFTTMRLSESIPSLQERQVIDNFARIAANPGAIPYYTVINGGTASISDTGSGGLYALNFAPHVFTSATLDATATRSVTGNWTLNPMTNPDRLRAMRAAYHIALGAEFIDPVDEKKLSAISKDQKDVEIPRGWIRVGTKHDVPRGACIVSHCGKTYVWVVPGHTKDFADFSLLMLNIATWMPPAAKAAQPSIRPRAEPLPRGEAAEEEAAGIQMRLYEDSPSVNRGLFFVPR